MFMLLASNRIITGIIDTNHQIRLNESMDQSKNDGISK